MTVNSVIGILVLPAVSFGLLYFPALTRISPTLASPYPKADVARRVLAAALDGSLFLTSLYFFLHAESAWFIAAGAAYVGMRDAMRGRSVGKFLAGLVVISLETGKPCSLAKRVNLIGLSNCQRTTPPQVAAHSSFWLAARALTWRKLA